MGFSNEMRHFKGLSDRSQIFTHYFLTQSHNLRGRPENCLGKKISPVIAKVHPNVHIDRMGENRLAKVAKECGPQGVRSRGRSKKKDEKRALMYIVHPG